MELFTIENLNTFLVIIFVLGLIVFAAIHIYLMRQYVALYSQPQRQLMSQYDYIKYCYNCDCEEIAPLSLDEINTK